MLDIIYASVKLLNNLNMIKEKGELFLGTKFQSLQKLEKI